MGETPWTTTIVLYAAHQARLDREQPYLLERLMLRSHTQYGFVPQSSQPTAACFCSPEKHPDAVALRQ